MKYFAPSILVIEAVVFLYLYLFPKSMWGSSFLEIVFGGVFLALAVWIYRRPGQRAAEWLTIILSILFGPGGFLGWGGLSAVLLAIVFTVASKKKKSAT